MGITHHSRGAANDRVIRVLQLKIHDGAESSLGTATLVTSSPILLLISCASSVNVAVAIIFDSFQVVRHSMPWGLAF